MNDIQNEATSRHQFEQTISSSPYELSIRRLPDNPVKYAWPGQYTDIDVERSFQFWKHSEERFTQSVACAIVDGKCILFSSNESLGKWLSENAHAGHQLVYMINSVQVV